MFLNPIPYCNLIELTIQCFCSEHLSRFDGHISLSRLLRNSNLGALEFDRWRDLAQGWSAGPACVRLGSVYYPGVNSSKASSISDYHHAASRACPVTSLGLDGPVRGLSVGWPGTKIRDMRYEGADCWVGAGRPGYIDWGGRLQHTGSQQAPGYTAPLHHTLINIKFYVIIQ